MATYNPNNPTAGSTMSGGTTGNTAGLGKSEEKGGGVTSAIGERLERAGDFLEDKGKGQFVADRLHSAGKYLQENDARTMARSIDSAICAHPYRAMVIGLGMGWVVGRFLSGRD